MKEQVQSFRDTQENLEAVQELLDNIKLTNKQRVTLARFYRACNVLYKNGKITNSDIVAAIFMEGAK